MKMLRFLIPVLLVMSTGAAFAQVEVYPPPPPQYYAPPPPGYPPPPPPPGYYHRTRYYHRAPPPWIRPPLFRGTLGISGFGTIVVGQPAGDYLSHGGGFSIWGGLEIGRVVGIEVKFASSFHNPSNDCGGNANYVWCTTSYLAIQTVSLDLKLHIPTNTRVVPYAVVGPMAGWIGRTGDYTQSTGGGFEAGGGVDVWFSRHGTVGVEVLYRGLLLSDYATYSNDKYISLVQIGATLAAHF